MRLTLPTIIAAVFLVPLMLIGFHFAANPGEARDQQLFVYGTLLNPIVRSVVCGCVVETEPTTLAGYEQVGRTIVPNKDAAVSGAFITVSDWELGWLDRYEGVPEDYRRERLVVSGEPAWVYIKNVDAVDQQVGF